MNIILNGKPSVADDGTSLTALLGEHGVDPDTVVVEYNGAVLAKDAWDTTVLAEDDEVELIRIVGGG